MKNGNSEIRVLEDARNKIRDYNEQTRARVYNSAYTKILDARKGRSCLVDKEGNMSEATLLIIEEGLQMFDMGRQMDNTFKYNLQKKLASAKPLLWKFQGLTIVSPNIDEIRSETESFFENLRACDHDRLSSSENQFSVGATKIMNFLFPELFVITDIWVRKALAKSLGHFSFDEYWSIMMACRRELRAWQKLHGTLENLIELDEKPTTLTRVFDKCAFVMGKPVQCPKCQKAVGRDDIDPYSGLCADCTRYLSEETLQESAEAEDAVVRCGRCGAELVEDTWEYGYTMCPGCGWMVYYEETIGEGDDLQEFNEDEEDEEAPEEEKSENEEY